MNSREEKVTLKPIFNIKPKIYIPIIYALLLLIVIFSITILPGLLKQGSNLTITSNPSGASVYINDLRVGSTPFSGFITNGSKSIVLKKADFRESEADIEINGNLFLSLFKKEEIKRHFNLRTDSGYKILEDAYREAAEWSLIDSADINSRYPIPPTISSAIESYYNASDFNESVLEEFLTSSIKLITDEYILSDYLKGLSIAVSDNRLPSISSIKESALFFDKVIGSRENAPLLLYNRILHNSHINMDNNLYQGLNDNHRKIVNKSVTTFDEQKKSIRLDELNFLNIPESTVIPTGVNFIHSIEEESFYILDKMVSRESYSLFLEDNPIWDRININNLIEDGLVDKNYLNFLNDEEYITNVSYYSALAWCSWANEKYNIPEGWYITLPTENQWFSALQYDILEDIEAWQWTSEGFFLYDHYLTDSLGGKIESFTKITPRLVVGKNKYNTKAESGRGVQDAQWCTPFTGFRPVLVKEE